MILAWCGEEPYLSAAEADCDDAQIMAIWEELCWVLWRGCHVCGGCAVIVISMVNSVVVMLWVCDKCGSWRDKE
jgi:hypothetical protein